MMQENVIQPFKKVPKFGEIACLTWRFKLFYNNTPDPAVLHNF